jgi:PAS domain S-box-containing protein
MVLLFFVMAGLIAGLLIYGLHDSPVNVHNDEMDGVTFSKQEESWIRNKDKLTISTEPSLAELTKPSGEIYAVLLNVFDGSGLKLDFVKGKADLRLVGVTNGNRDTLLRQGRLTVPITQISGVLFRRAGKNRKNTVVVIRNDFSRREIRAMRYNGIRLKVIICSNMQQAVDKARSINAGYIAGEETMMRSVLAAEKLDRTYLSTGKSVFRENICMLVPRGQTMEYRIVNTYAQHIAYGVARYSNSLILIVIILAAVAAALFIYLFSSGNLYSELSYWMQQLRESRSELNATFNGVPMMMAEMSPEGTVEDANTQMLKRVGCTISDIIGNEVGEVMGFSAQNMQKLDRLLEQVRQSGEGGSLTVKDGGKIYDIDVYPIEQGKGGKNMLLFIASDVTELRTAQRQMLQQNKMAAVGQLAVGVAHEIRNPLGIIRNYCYVLKNTDDPKLKEQAVATIEKSVDRSGNIITTLLDFSRQSDMQARNFMIRQHIEEVLRLHQGSIKKKNITVNLSPGDDFDVTLSVESFDMILMNLVSNGVDAIGEGGTVDIGLGKNDDSFEMRIADDGCGMDEDVLKDIFNPFFTTKEGSKGNGLGLYIVYNEVNKMNGSISVESEPGRGTKFCIRLPRNGGADGI